MISDRSKWPVAVASAAVLVFLVLLLAFEKAIVDPGIVPALDESLLPNLYQIAVAGLLDQSSFFSSWSIGLLLAGWYVMIHGLDKRPRASLAVLFVCLCGSVLLSIFIGQMLHQVVVGSITIHQDPLQNPMTSTLIRYQYFATVAAALLVALAVVGRLLLD